MLHANLLKDLCERNKRPEKSSEIPAEIQQIIFEKCLRENPARRPEYVQRQTQKERKEGEGEELLLTLFFSFAELKALLEKARLQYFLGFDESAMEFWEKFWPNSAKADWFTRSPNCFVNTLCRHFSWPMVNPKVYRKEIPELPFHSNGIVTIENFRNLLLWFGPFWELVKSEKKSQKVDLTNTVNYEQDSDETSGESSGEEVEVLEETGIPFLSHLEEACDQPWFWGSVSNELAVSSLKGAEIGNFLVRLNTGKNFSVSETPFTILVVDKNRSIQTLRVWFRPNMEGFRVFSEILGIDIRTKTRSICALIFELNNMKILGKACPSAIFKELNFEEKNFEETDVVSPVQSCN